MFYQNLPADILFGSFLYGDDIMGQENNEYIVEGYLFLTEQEAKLAKKELDAINYMRKMNNMNNPKVMFQVYEKMISRKLFVTTIGMDYLKGLQKQLRAKYNKDDIPPIPVLDSDSNPDVSAINVRKSMLEFEDVGNYFRRKIKVLIVINIMLIAALICMIILAATTNSAHILNYEKTLINRYEQWEQELEQREEELNNSHK